MESEISVIQNKILVIRNQQVMIDRDIAELYGVETKVLNQAVKRNIERFPENFMFQLDEIEFKNWRSQFVTSNSDKMGLRRRTTINQSLVYIATKSVTLQSYLICHHNDRMK